MGYTTMDINGFLTLLGFAERVGIKRSTLGVMRHREQLPEPDVMIRGRPGWHPETVDTWAHERNSPSNPAPTWADLPDTGDHP